MKRFRQAAPQSSFGCPQARDVEYLSHCLFADVRKADPWSALIAIDAKSLKHLIHDTTQTRQRAGHIIKLVEAK